MAKTTTTAAATIVASWQPADVLSELRKISTSSQKALFSHLNSCQKVIWQVPNSEFYLISRQQPQKTSEKWKSDHRQWPSCMMFIWRASCFPTGGIWRKRYWSCGEQFCLTQKNRRWFRGDHPLNLSFAKKMRREIQTQPKKPWHHAHWNQRPSAMCVSTEVQR